MIEIKIKSLWDKKAWVHQKYLKQAQQEGKDLLLKLRLENQDEEIMVIDKELIHPKYWTKSEKEYRDRFSNEKYTLWGIEWKPSQNKLL